MENEDTEKALIKKEMLTSITKDVLAQKANDILASKTKDVLIAKVDNFDDQDFVWGTKQNRNNYKSVMIKDEVYALNDCVRCRSGLELDYIGKIMKLSEENDKKICTLRWFFRPSELPTSIKGMSYTPNARELFLAFGEGVGVENKNFLVSCHNISNIRDINNVENVVSLGAIIDKCKILCIAKDDFNDLPSSEHLNACEFYFSKAFDCNTLEIVGLDGVVDAIGAQKVYNKKEWLNNKIDKHSASMISSLEKTLCQSFASYSLPMNPNDKKALPLLHCNSPPSITEQSTKRKIIEKRKRETKEEEMLSPKKMEKVKKIKLSPTTKNSKLAITSTANLTLTKQDHTTELVIESKNGIIALDAVQTLSTIPILSKGSQFASFNEILNLSKHDHQTNGNFKSSLNFLINAPIISKHTIEGVGNNADDIHVTCEGFPVQNFLDPLERSESSTSKLKKQENNSNLIIAENGINNPNEPTNLKKSKATLAKERRIASKTTRNRRGKNLSNITSNVILKKPTTRKSGKCNVARRAQDKSKKIKESKIETKQLITPDSYDSERHGEDFITKHEFSFQESNVQPPLGSLLVATQSTTMGKNSKDANVLNVESLESLQTTKKVKDASPHFLDEPPMQLLESKCEDWDKAIEKAIVAKRVLLLNNLDPELHPTDLEDALTKLLKTKCEVRKAIPLCFFYDTTSALLKLMTTSIAEEVLQNLCKNCLVIGERTVIASLYENLEFMKEVLKFPGHINLQPNCEPQNNDCNGMAIVSHIAQGGTIEFTFGLRWRLLQEQHELQWKMLKELHGKELDTLKEETSKKTRSKKLR